MELANEVVVVSSNIGDFFEMVDGTTNPTPNNSLTEEAVEAVREQKRSAADTIRDQAGKLGAEAADRARNFAGEGKDRATGALDEVAKMFENAAGDVDAKLGEQYGQYARSAAEGISKFSESLRGKEVDDLISDATAFVKKSPVIAVGAAAAVGFVLARLIKSGIDANKETADTSEGKSGSDDKA